ncbi:unnamed protein product [Trifolium pratense]|uniref:Uncharacterized protein n=1 Tax=Trifolium pratense TaxID=57577 RepID=A0ACB0JLN4_TRIPR|nr:unnamed protein product [Trifolium pratense]
MMNHKFMEFQSKRRRKKNKINTQRSTARTVSRFCFLFLDPSLSKSLFLSHPPPPAAALNPSLTALNLSPSPRRNAVQSSAAAAPLLSSPRRTTPHRTHSFSSSRFRFDENCSGGHSGRHC